MAHTTDGTAKPLLSTVTGEAFQPVRLRYQVSDRKRLDKLFDKLGCMNWDPNEKRWVWLYHAETKSLEFDVPYRKLDPNLLPVVIGEVHFEHGHALFDLRSIDRALHAAEFMRQLIPERVAKLNDLDIANFLTPAVEENLSLKPMDIFDQHTAERVLSVIADLPAAETLMSPDEAQARATEMMAAVRARQLPRVENLLVSDDQESQLLASLSLRARLAIEHWNGNTSLTIGGLILQSLEEATQAGAFGDPNTDDGWDDDLDEEFDDDDDDAFDDDWHPDTSHWDHRETGRLSWNFADGIPTRDIFETFDLSDPTDVGEAVDEFTGMLRDGDFRLWEAIMREEQSSRTLPELKRIAEWEMEQVGDDDDVVRENSDGFARFHEPWYASLRRLVPHLVMKPLQTSETYNESTVEAWGLIANALQHHARHLSLPEDACHPVEVIPPDVRYALTIQTAMYELHGIDGVDDFTLLHPDHAFRIDRLVTALTRCVDSVSALNLTLDTLLDFIELPEADDTHLRSEFTQRLSLESSTEPLAPKLAASRKPQVPLAAFKLKKAALTHPELPVRDNCAQSLWRTGTKDLEVTEQVLAAIDRYGLEEAFIDYEFLSDLPQSADTLKRILEHFCDCENFHLSGELVDEILQFPPLVIAAHHESVISALEPFIPHEVQLVGDVVKESQMSPDELWERLRECLESPQESHGTEPTPNEVSVAARITDLLGADDRLVSWTMDSLSRCLSDERYSLRDELLAAVIADRLRLDASIPYLVPMLQTGVPNSPAADALRSIGSDQIVELLDELYHGAGETFRLAAVDVVEDIYSERSQQALRRWLNVEEDSTCRTAILSALLSLLDVTVIPQANENEEVARGHFEANPFASNFVTACLLTGTEASSLPSALRTMQSVTPEWSDFHYDDSDDDWLEDSSRSMFPGSTMGGVAHRLGGWDDDSDEDDESWSDDDSLEDDGVRSVGPIPSSPDQIVNDTSKVGRNDPCPCGSGKKYKKCCR